jgi:2-succinyl-5-enolpyruvyl-6-hydroxy-3-cyclohexene-1-carboxylate synthase
MLTQEQVTFAYVGAFVDELARAGLRHVCLAPGSRSTPLAVMVARHPDLRLWLHLDERSAAFFALGMAKASREPVALICTSGTATANFFPAVIEARYARVPLLVLTADRPPELRDAGAPQTIDQIRLYGSQVKWSVELAVPEATPELLRYARTIAGRAVATTLAEPAGPVHLNFPLREPLMPLPFDPAGIDVDAGGSAAWSGRPDGQPYVAIDRAGRLPNPSDLDGLLADLHGAERGLIVCGPQADPGLAAPLARLAAVLGFPILADPLSHVRCGPHDRSAVIDSYDAFLRDGRLVERLAPEVVLRFGAMPTSKPVLLYLQRHPEARQVLIDGAGAGGWEDPTLLASRALQANPAATAEALCDALAHEGRDRAFAPGWLDAWRRIDRLSRAAIEGQLAENDEPFEGRAFAELARLLPDGATLFASSSMPVRDLDTFFPASERRIRFLSNRGANGIDGVISSALGARAASASDGPLLLAIGDIAFYHDMNGLLAAKLHGLDATILLLNNDGGGIFSFLPQAAYPEHFEALFGTPHGLDFRPAAELYGARYHRVEHWGDFRRTVGDALDAPGLKIVELRTERSRNVALHRQIWPAVFAAVAVVDEVSAGQPVG